MIFFKSKQEFILVQLKFTENNIGMISHTDTVETLNENLHKIREVGSNTF
jgi:hypothetical protein